MLHIKTYNSPSMKGLPSEHGWHVGEKFPFTYEEICLVSELQADGDELMEVLDYCPNIPRSPGRVIRWFGDHAKFIAGVLCSLTKTERLRNDRTKRST